MELAEFIVSSIKIWKTMFPLIHVKYAYDKVSNYHIIEITPHEVYEDNRFSKFELKVWEDFATLFPDNDLLITEPNCCNNMSNLTFEV